MGLGKTLEVIAHLLKEREEGKSVPATRLLLPQPLYSATGAKRSSALLRSSARWCIRVV